MEKIKKLRLVLGDQLNSEHSWFTETDPNTIFLMAEMRQETDYVKHHIQKIVAFFLSMRNFAESLEKSGHSVLYFKINDAENPQNLALLIKKCVLENNIEKFEYLLPDEYRLDQQMKQISNDLGIKFEAFDTEHFYTSRTDLKVFFEGKKLFLMENFYRMMRKKHRILMTGEQPEGGKWNFDHENRKKYTGQVPIPDAIQFSKNIEKVLVEIEASGVSHFGKIDSNNFVWPTSREECLEQLHFFCDNLISYFGDFEDAMHTQQKFLFHSRLSFAMNTKMLSPAEVIEAVLSSFEAQKTVIIISQVEGFVRQILGWREYIRGIYWNEMPNYAQKNHLNNHNNLPEFFWTGKTKMNCMSHAINQSLDDAYAHHIQRLMILGNFLLLTETNPDQVDHWYLGIYIDAIEWVEMPNTRGMSQFADGGIIATKPYVSSGSYINKMSNYCTNCHYNVKEKLGENACPFNSLYWNFLDEKKDFFKNNNRMGMMMNLLKKMPADEIFKIKTKAASILGDINNY